MNSADAGIWRRRFRLKMSIASARRHTRTNAPITPPAIAPALECATAVTGAVDDADREVGEGWLVVDMLLLILLPIWVDEDV